jgi:hypothetical protein
MTNQAWMSIGLHRLELSMFVLRLLIREKAVMGDELLVMSDFAPPPLTQP